MRRTALLVNVTLVSALLGATAVGVGCGDDGPGCTDDCEVVSEARCNGTFVQLCVRGSDGCLGWTDSVDCGEDMQVCDDSTGNVICVSDCQDLCAEAGDTQCNGSWIQTCEALPNGCLDWSQTLDCAEGGQLCEDYTGDASCMDECVDECDTLADTQCSGTVIQSCVTGPDGCLDWEGGTDCASSGELCDDSGGEATCVIDCAVSGPAVPGAPTPAHQSTQVDESSVTSVSWADSAGASSYDVYFGDTCPPPTYPDPAFQNVTASELTGLTLAPDTGYCWQVVALDANCAVQGPQWTFHTTCSDPVPGAPVVTSSLAVEYPQGTTSGTYTLTFSEDVSGVTTGLQWTPVVGSGTMGAVIQVGPQTYTVPFLGVADGDQYTLTVTTSVQDLCGAPLSAAVDVAITVASPSAGTGLTCADAIDLNATGLPGTTVGSFTDSGVTGGSCDSTADNVVWYTYSPPVTGWYTVDATNAETASNPYSRIAVFETSSCSPYGAEVGCVINSDNLATLSPIHLDSSQTYLIMFYTDGPSYFMVDPSINISPAAPPPAGTTCQDPIDLDTTALPHQEVGAFNTNGAIGGSCDTVADHAVWYSFTPPATGWYTIDATNTETLSNPYSRVAVFETTACSPYGAEVVCRTASTNSISVSNVYLDAGTTYTVMFYTDGASYDMVDPTIDISSQPPPPTGSICSTAIDLDALGLPYQASGSFTDAGEGGSCDTTADNTVWYTWTAPADGWYSIDASNLGSSTGSRLAVFEGSSCTPLGAEVVCATSSTAGFEVGSVWMTSGTTYTIVHYTTSTGTMVDPTIDIGPGTAPPPGLTCAAPALVTSANHTLDATGHHCWSWVADLADTSNDHDFTCDGVVGGDVVVEYTTGAGETTLAWDAAISNYASSAYIGLEITEGPCDTGASLYCTSAGTTGTFDDSGTASVQPNTTYYIWITDGYVFNPRPDVDICLWSY